MTGRKQEKDKVRLPKEARTQQIILAAADAIREKGAREMTLDDVAKRVGITRAGVINCVGSKDGLLALVIEKYHDEQGAVLQYLNQFEPGGERADERPSLPEFCWVAVHENDENPELLMLFHMLSAEVSAQDSPGQQYFSQRRNVESYVARNVEWDMPDGVDGYDMFLLAMATMYGTEHFWLNGLLEGKLADYWTRAEKVLFPLPLWEGRV
jgi:AcrR family transcriptional regulator